MNNRTDDTAARFHSRCQTTAAGCRLWTGARTRSGYGVVRWRGRLTTARRIAYALAYGPIPPDHLVSVTCGQRDCVLPAHLALQRRADVPAHTPTDRNPP